ncbi:MAG: hypothetical protein QXU18_10510 [Thermoplasmatales archaeon]
MLVAGLSIGLAFMRVVAAFIFCIIGFAIASYVGLAFCLKIPITYEFHKWSMLLLNYLSIVKFGSVILFLIGLAISLWKG